jgi:hypothetical protein
VIHTHKRLTNPTLPRFLWSSLKLFKNVAKGKQQNESCRQVCAVSQSLLHHTVPCKSFCPRNTHTAPWHTHTHTHTHTHNSPLAVGRSSIFLTFISGNVATPPHYEELGAPDAYSMGRLGVAQGGWTNCRVYSGNTLCPITCSSERFPRKPGTVFGHMVRVQRHVFEQLLVQKIRKGLKLPVYGHGSRPSATSVWDLKLLLYETLGY